MKLSLTVVLILILVLFISGCSQGFNEAAIKKSMDADKKIMEEAITLHDANYCEKITYQQYKNKCYFNLSEYNSDWCGQIKASYCGNYCVDAESTLNPNDKTYCLKFYCADDSPLISTCYKQVYDKTKDEKYCTEMQLHGGEYWATSECFKDAGYTGEELCKQFNISYLDYWNCYMNDIHIPLNLSAQECDSFSKISRDNSERCHSDLAVILSKTEGNITHCNGDVSCIMQVIKATNDTSLCSNVVSNMYQCNGARRGDRAKNCLSDQEYCEYTFNRTKFISWDFCKNSAPDSGDCIIDWAVMQNNDSICKSEFEPAEANMMNSYRDICYWEFARHINITYCSKISDISPGQKSFDCYYYTALEKNDSSICEYILGINVTGTTNIVGIHDQCITLTRK